MKRLHVSLGAADLEKSAAFYSAPKIEVQKPAVCCESC